MDSATHMFCCPHHIGMDGQYIFPAYLFKRVSGVWLIYHVTSDLRKEWARADRMFRQEVFENLIEIPKAIIDWK